MFCKTEIEDGVVYIDASGISFDFRDLLPMYKKGDEISDITYIESYTPDGEYDVIGLDFARRFIDRYEDYYDVSPFKKG